jgi:Ca2+-binding RTX toxin-like protein
MTKGKKMGRTFKRWIVACVAVLPLVSAGCVATSTNPDPPPVQTLAVTPDSAGSDFWLNFSSNISPGPELSLFITGSTSTTGTVAIGGLSFSQNFSVTAGTVTTVSIPTEAMIATSDVVGDLGIHVTAGAEVTVYGLNRILNTTDAYLGLPTDILGTEYIVEGYKNVDIVNATEFSLTATQNSTTVTIVPSVTTGTHTAGTPYNVSMNQGQTYQLINDSAAPADLSGTIVTSDKPIAVFGGHGCANIPPGAVACDHVVEEMTPTTTWGKAFLTEPLATRTGGDTFRFLASTNATAVKVNGSTVATLNRGQLFETILTAASVVTADKPILVTQYSNSSSFDNVTSDPFEVIVPPNEQFLATYTVTTPATGFDINFINVVAPTSEVGSVRLDGVAIPAASFSPIAGSGFSGAQVPVNLGSHSLTGPQPFGITVYGFADFDSYGYPGGLSLAPVATVTNLALAPKTATNPTHTEHCLTATVTDQNGAAVVGVRVDFTVAGVNPTSGFVNTGTDGKAQFCYTGVNPGTDTITASVGTVTDTATKLWQGGTSQFTCHGLPATIVGTPGDDNGKRLPNLSGTPGRDVIVGLGGNDWIKGFGGDDVLCGGDGSDIMQGFEGNDYIEGGNGKDSLKGGDGNDELHGLASDDHILGENGNDALFGETGNDVLDGGSGTDTCSGGAGVNSIRHCP